MNMFKLQHPQDLISRLFILEYIKELGVDLVIDRLSEGEKNFWVYKFEGDESIQYDFNWEYLLFVIPLINLSKIMERFLPEIEVIEKNRTALLQKKREEIQQEKLATPVDMNLMDMAKAEIEKSKSGEWLS